MRLWDIRQHTRIAYAFPVLPPSGHQDHTNVVAFSPDGHTVVFGTHDAHVDYWDPSTNHVRHLTHSHTNQMGSVRFSPEGHRFLSASGDYTWQMWDYAGGVPESARGTAGAPVHDAVFLPDGLRVVTCDESGAVRRWDAITGADLGVIHKFPQPAISLAVSAALPLIAVGLGANGGIVVVSTDDDRILQRLPAATPHVGGMVFAPDGRTLIAAVSQPDIRVYDAVTGTTLQTAVDGVSGVRSVALNSTGTTMATGSSDGRVRLWHRVGRDIPPIDPDITGDGPVVSSSNTPTDVSGQVAVADAPAAPIPAVVGTLPSPIAPASAPESLHVGPKTYALLVGVDVYDNFSGLVNPVADITAVEKELRETYGVDTLLLANPTRASFLEQLYALASREYSDEDQVLVFFSGHGVFDDRINRGHLALRDAKPPSEDPLWDTLVSHENVRTVLERLKCRHVLLVVDSCFSGTLDPSIAMATAGRASGGGMYEGIPRDEYIARKMKFTTRRYITAGGKEFVPDGRPGQHSPFARQFLAALRNLGGDDGILTFEEIAQYMERVDPQPLSGELYGNEPGSSFVLVTQDNRLSATDTPFGSLDVEVIPSAATVVVGQYEGNEYGRPRSLRIEPVTKQLRRYRLPLGEYRLHVSASGHVEEEITVVISDEPLVIEVRLRRAP
jgi:hypothetical protein